MTCHLQISKLTEKMNKISKDLSTEKTAAEKLQKNSSGQLSQHVSENRKLALEMSKLKVSNVHSLVFSHILVYVSTPVRRSCHPATVLWESLKKK